jgi:hypothetical protein
VVGGAATHVVGWHDTRTGMAEKGNDVCDDEGRGWALIGGPAQPQCGGVADVWAVVTVIQGADNWAPTGLNKLENLKFY